ncbi:MAG: amidohydrolase [Betaproteobacteria bacterium]|nr:amidohydrolase [Betaproteobacteria bacterium]MDE2124664.1 amidohydrolase [Betaproteobacteria bacterium]MDE2187400.1 amidohydrolase [Betaproteobacteria bacterium]MDE2323523.1 amidohydrolase [Betaproteobacteria bacterium]
MQIIDSIVTEAARFRAIRRDIHAHPELCFHEDRTSDTIATLLAEWGLPVHRGLGKTGVVAVIEGSKGPGRGIGLRADIDALPVTEKNTFAHVSTHPGKMHACGHDGHTAMLLAAAHHLSRNRDFAGRVVCIFQPAEEGGGGAREMIKDGLFDKFPVDAVFGMHNWPGLPAGHFAVRAGPVMASSNEFRIVVRGKGSHAAMPHLGLDPLPAACQMALGFQTIISRNKNPQEAGVISVTMIHAGEATNVVPDSVEIQGTARTFTTELLDLIESRMREMAQHTAQAFGMQCDFTFHRNYPPTINHAAEAEFARHVMRELVGEEAVHDFEPSMGAEDFAYMLQARPGAYVIIGNGGGDHRSPGHGAGPCTLHNASYDFNDDIIPLGASFWVQLSRNWLAQV